MGDNKIYRNSRRCLVDHETHYMAPFRTRIGLVGMGDTATVGFLLVGVALLGFGAGLGISVSLYTGSESSRLYALSRLVDVYPSITKPEGHVRFNQKLWTTTLVLIIYFMMTNVMIYGLSDSTLDIFSSFRSIMAGASGSIMHLGIGPIVRLNYYATFRGC